MVEEIINREAETTSRAAEDTEAGGRDDIMTAIATNKTHANAAVLPSALGHRETGRVGNRLSR